MKKVDRENKNGNEIVKNGEINRDLRIQRETMSEPHLFAFLLTSYVLVLSLLLLMILTNFWSFHFPVVSLDCRL